MKVVLYFVLEERERERVEEKAFVTMEYKKRKKMYNNIKK